VIDLIQYLKDYEWHHISIFEDKIYLDGKEM